jgi:hypothetical protein
MAFAEFTNLILSLDLTKNYSSWGRRKKNKLAQLP